MPLEEPSDLQDASSHTPSVEPTLPGTWIISLTVSDGKLDSQPDVVRLDVSIIDDQVTVCAWYGEFDADNNEGFILSFEPY